MKKFTAILVVLMMAVMTLVPVFNANAESQLYVDTENGKTLNLRAAPDTDSKILARLGEGKAVTLICSAADVWARVSVKLNGKTVTGYVMRHFLTSTDPANNDQSFTKVSPFKVKVAPSNGSNGHVNLRAKASTNSTVLNYLHKGDVLTVKAESHSYYKVTTAQGRTGYVLKAFVTK